jgi:hypothetical protein
MSAVMDIPRGRILIGFCWALLAIAPQGCGGPTFIVQQYSGEVRPAETIGIIRVNGQDPVILASIDGEPTSVQVAKDARMHIEVLPGKHTIGIANPSDVTRPPAMVSFRADAGKFYRPIFMQPDQARQVGYRVRIGAARIFQVDSGSDALIGDVTLPERAESPSLAPGDSGEGTEKPAIEGAIPADAGPAEPPGNDAGSDGGQPVPIHVGDP